MEKNIVNSGKFGSGGNKRKKQPRILVVDDEEDIRLLARSLLEVEDLDTIFASNGKEALDIFKKEGRNIDLLIVDISMPVMDGTELVKKIREELKSQVPVVILTAHMESAFEKLFTQRYHINAYIMKPFGTEEFVKKIKDCLKSD